MKNTTTNIELDFQLLFESAPGLFLVLEPDAKSFTILGASQAYLNATKTRRSEIIGRPLFEVFPDNPNDTTATGTKNLRRSLENVLTEKKADTMAVQKYDIPKPASEGGGFEVRYWSPYNSPVLNSKKELVYIIHRVEDVTEMVTRQHAGNEEIRIAKEIRMKVEADLNEKSQLIESNNERINKILEALLKYTMRDFSNQIEISEKGDELDAIAMGLNTLSQELESHIKEIETTNNLLAFTNKELESFSYSVSHDLRAPLRAINGYSQVLTEDYAEKFDAEGKRIIETICANAKKMGTLIDELLAFSRLGKKEVNKIDIDMNELVSGVLSEIRKSLPHKASIKVNKLHPVKGDFSLLTQVMSNLILNGIKYSSKKSAPVVEISSEEKENEILFCIKDNGAGFDMRYADKLFGVFQRLHSQEEFEGTGVGLAIVQRIVAKHGGKVWAEGEVDKGATFYFTLTKN